MSRLASMSMLLAPSAASMPSRSCGMQGPPAERDAWRHRGMGRGCPHGPAPFHRREGPRPRRFPGVSNWRHAGALTPRPAVRR